MPALQQHLAQAEKNERLAGTIASLAERYTEWEVTIVFYSGLHYLDAFLATRGIHPRTHCERNDLASNLTGLARYYDILFKWIMNARYHLYNFTPQEVDRIKTGAFCLVKEEVIDILGNRAEGDVAAFQRNRDIICASGTAQLKENLPCPT
jgi:hypothetical protein